MDMMENGDLRAYLASNTPKRHVQLSWFIRMARGMAFIHGRRVIITDVRLENFLLDNQLAVKFADFGESRLMPLDWDLNGTDKLGFSVMTDIGQLGAVIYRIVTGQDCNFIVWHEGTKVTWPERDRLPSTESVWLGHIVERCWTRGFTGADEIAKELENVARVFDHNFLI